MKKLIISVAVLSLVLVSCSKEKAVTGFKSLEQQLTEVENNVLSLDASNIKNIKTVFDNFNTKYFSKISTLITNANQESLNESKNDYIKDVMANFNVEAEKNKTILSRDQKMIFESYIKSVKNSELTNSEVTSYYIGIIETLNTSLTNRDFCLRSLSFNKSFFDFVDYDNLRMESRSFDDCWDDCMRAKAKAIWEDGNFIDQIEFLASGGVAVLYWTASCSWNCF